MKKSNILISSAAALVALIAVTGIALSTMAVDDTSDTNIDAPCLRHFWGKNLTEEDKAIPDTERGMDKIVNDLYERAISEEPLTSDEKQIFDSLDNQETDLNALRNALNAFLNCFRGNP